MTCHSDKSTCDMLQYLNLSSIKHLLSTVCTRENLPF